ncbi:Kcnh5, partial [Symbiodinium necroappetens]
DAVENAKEVCDFRYAEIEGDQGLGAPERKKLLTLPLTRTKELLSNMRHAEEIIAGVRETLHALCGQSQLKLADTRQVPPDFQPETLDSDSAPPPCPNGPPHPPVKVSATAPISVPTALPLKAQVRMDQVVLEALREDNKRK